MWVHDVAAVVVGLAATVTAAGVLGRLRPVRWLARTLIGDPVTAAIRNVVTEAVDDALDNHRPSAGQDP